MDEPTNFARDIELVQTLTMGPACRSKKSLSGKKLTGWGKRNSDEPSVYLDPVAPRDNFRRTRFLNLNIRTFPER